MTYAIPPWLRVYAHCAQGQPRGAVVLVLINVAANQTAQIYPTNSRALGVAKGKTSFLRKPALAGPRLEYDLWSYSLASKRVFLNDRELEEEERPALGHVASRLPILRCEVDEARRPVFDQGRRAHHADRDEAAEVLILVSDGADLVEATHARCGVRGQREVAEGSLRHFELMILR